MKIKYPQALASRLSRPLFLISLAIIVVCTSALALGFGWISDLSPHRLLPHATGNAATAKPLQPERPAGQALLTQATDRLRSATAFRMLSTVDQTLVPRAVPGMIGQQEQTLTIAIDGEVSGPNQSRTTLTVDPGNISGLRNLKPVTLIRDGSAVYAEKDGQRIPYQGDSVTFAPIDNGTDYLAAASNPHALESRTLNGVTYQRIGFDLTGADLAQALQRSAQRSNPNGNARATDALRNSHGSGELWLDPAGIPAHQVINLEIAQLSPQYDGRLHMSTDFTGWVGVAPQAPAQQAPAQHNDAPPQSPINSLGQSADAPWALPAAFLALGGVAMCAYALLYRRHRRLAYAVMAFGLSFLLSSTAPLRAAAAELSSERQRNLPSVFDLLGLPHAANRSDAAITAPATPPVPSAPLKPVAFGDPIQVCGAGRTSDTDGDGISDLDESCLGTNPYDEDSDSDGLPDGFETKAINYRNQTWYLNPAKMDTNDDGIPDLGEMPSTAVSMTINNVITNVIVGNAPINATHDKTIDWDNDGIPNAFDDDNDGDGVPDALDLSPYALGNYASTIDFRSQNATNFTGTQYLELQFQPQDAAHLRYGLSQFEWAINDHLGTMQNRTNNGTALLRLVPMLEVDINAVSAPRTYSSTKDYGLNIRDELLPTGQVRFYAPVQIIGNGGAARAFTSKFAFAGAEARNINLSARLVWFVNGNTQTDSTNPSKTEPVVLTVYRGESIRVTGLSTSNVMKAEAIIVGAPSSPTDDKNLIVLTAGINSFFLGLGTVPTPTLGQSTLQEANTRFNSITTTADLRMGVPTTVVLKSQYTAGPHTDSVLANQGRSIDKFLSLNDFDTPFNQPTTPRCNDGSASDIKCVTLLMALDEQIGETGLDDTLITQSSGNGTATYTVNMGEVAIARRKTTKLQMFERLNSGWHSVELARSLAILHNRYNNQRSALETLLKAAYPYKTWEDFLVSLFTIYYEGFAGYSSVEFNADAYYPDAGDAINRAAFVSGLGGLPSLVRVVNDLREAAAAARTPVPTIVPGSPPPPTKSVKLKNFEKGFNYAQVAVSVIAIVISIVGAACGDDDCDPTAMDVAIRGVGVLGMISSGIDVAYKSYQIHTRVGTIKDALPALDHKWSNLGKLGKASAVTAVLGFLFTASVGIAELVLTINSVKSGGLSHLFTNEAIANFVGLIVYAVIQLVLTFIPGVGQIIGAILGFIDALVTLITGGESTTSAIIVKFFYDVNIATELDDTEFGDVSTTFLDEDKGMIAGNSIIISSNFTGKVVPVEDDLKTSYLKKSTVAGNYDVEAWQTFLNDVISGKATLSFSAMAALPIGSATDPDCTVSKSVNTCKNVPRVTVPLAAGANQSVGIRPVIKFKYATQECTFQGSWCFEPDYTSTTLGREDDDGNATAYSTIYFDVLPATVDTFFSWSGIRTTLDQWNRDRDGDGLLNSDETVLNLGNKTNWDSDGDGLSDKFELDNNISAALADTDHDGISDGDEVAVGLKPNMADTDNDGLSDGAEYSHRVNNTYVLGGWNVTLPSGRIAHVYSDPFIRDFDADGVIDSVEQAQGSSPWAIHVETTLDMGSAPITTSPDRSKTGLYVGAGQGVTLTVNVVNFVANGYTSTLSLCVPAELTNLSTPSTDGSNHVPLPVAGVCTGGTRYSLDFGSPNTLLYAEQINMTIHGTIQSNISGSKIVTASAQLQFPDHTTTVDKPIYIDGVAPTVSLIKPSSGEFLRRAPGGSTYIVGGYASDADTWLNKVEINTGSGFTTANGLGSWQAAWQLPSTDGIYSLQARSTDFVGRVSAISTITNIIVDGTPPTATLALAPGLYIRPALSSSVVLTGSASDNLAGLLAVEISIDGGPYRLAQFTPALSSSVVYTWEIPALSNAQGQHTFVIRARDNSGNIGTPYTTTLFIDTLPPDSNLITRQYVNAPLPILRSNTPITLYGRANELGYHPLPPSPAALQGNLDVLKNATAFYGADRAADMSGNIRLAWAGDIDADRRADFIVGQTAAENGAGRINIVYGKSGNFQPLPYQERMRDAHAALVGVSGAGIGDFIAPVGDVNADGYNDLLIGDKLNNRAFLVYGRGTPLGSSVVLSNGISGQVNKFALSLGGANPVLAPAGDVNADGFDDFFVGAAGGTVALVMGRSGYGELSIDPFANAATTITLPIGGRVTGVGDMDGDGRDDFAIAAGNVVSLYLGSASFVRNGKVRLPTPIATFASQTANANLVALGDVNGDGRADFGFPSGSNANIVLGRASSGPWGISQSRASVAGEIIALGDINADGRADFMLRDINISGIFEMRVYFGGATPSVGPSIVGVGSAANAPYGAGANLNCDASADLLFLPKSTSAPTPEANTGFREPDNHLALDPLVVGLTLSTTSGYLGSGLQSQAAIRHLIGDNAISTSNVVVDDDYCSTCANDGLSFGSTAFADIQSAINAVAAGSQVNVLPGVYGGFTIANKNNISVLGAPSGMAEANRTGAESVFVDGSAGPQVVRISNATGVRVSNMLLRNATVGLDLISAGIGGASSITNQTKLDRLIVYGTSVASVQMTRDSSAWLERTSLALDSLTATHFNIVGSASVVPARKLTVTNSVMIAPIGVTAFTWFSPTTVMADFDPPNNTGIKFINGLGELGTTTWTPAVVFSNQWSRNYLSGCGLLDEQNAVYNFSCTPMGYHSDRPVLDEAYVSPDLRSGVPSNIPANDVRLFRSIQSAIFAGYKKINIVAGNYQENINLADGVQLIGSGAAQTTLQLPAGSTRPLVQADGVRSAGITGLTLLAPGGTALSADGGARLTLRRNIIRDSAVGIAIKDAATQLVAINNTFVRNGDAFAASANAGFSLRNNGFVQNTGTALSFQSAATTKQHEYNAYDQNTTELRIDGTPSLANGLGEIAAEPIFNNPIGNDFRLRPGSAWINAGSPSDPTPPGTGDYVDIGYAETQGATLFVSPSYCVTCANDGLVFGKTAFSGIDTALNYAYANGLTNIDVAVGAGTYNGFLQIRSAGLRLIGQGADSTVISRNNGQPIFVNASNVEISGFTLAGASNTIAVSVEAAARNFKLSRSVVRFAQVGVHFKAGSTGSVVQSTLVGNGNAVLGDNANNLIDVDSSIFSGNSVAAVAGIAGTLRVRYSMFFSNGVDFTSEPISATSNLTATNPLFINAGALNYKLSPTSPAIDVGNPRLIPAAGSGLLPDMGYSESTARPIVLMLGTVGTLCSDATAGVASVEYGVSNASSVTSALTSTLPATWLPAALSNQGLAVTNWQSNLVASGDGLRRLYSRASDVLGNQENPTVKVTDNFGKRLPAPVLNVFDGSFYVDGTAPSVSMMSPTSISSTIARSMDIEASVSDADPTGAFTANAPYFLVNGDYVPGFFLDTNSAATTRRFVATIGLDRGATYSITAHAMDAVGYVANSAVVTVQNSLSVQPLTPTLSIIAPVSGTILGPPPTITLRGTISWTHPLNRFLRIAMYKIGNGGGCEDLAADLVSFDDPFAGQTGWQAQVLLGDADLDGTYIFCVRFGDANTDGYAEEQVWITYDETGPIFKSLTPSQTITTNTPLTGTVVDEILTTYVDRVEMSLDGGGAWEVITQTGASPPGITLTSFNSTFIAPDDLDNVALPVLFRAWDRYGNSSISQTVMTVDNVPPRLDPATTSIPVGTHFSATQNLVITWTVPTDGSGVITVTGAVNTSPEFTPTTVITTGAITVPLNVDGVYYGHLEVTDPSGNTSTYTYGPWYADLKQFCEADNLRLQLDGQLDVNSGEWRPNMLLDDDERPWMLSQNARIQRLYAQWDKNAFYVGWDGASFSPGVDGRMYVYLSSGNAGLTTLISPTQDNNTLPFSADTAIVVDSPISGTLYRVNAGVWAAVGPISTTTGDNFQTEARIPFVAPLNAGTNVQMIAYAQKYVAVGIGAVTSIFPTTNPLSGPWSDKYQWSPICSVTVPPTGQPHANSVVVSMAISETSAIPYPKGQLLTHLITIKNYETRPQENTPSQALAIVMTPTAGLTYAAPQSTDTTIVCCGLTNGHYSLPQLPVATRGPSVVTVTQIGTVAANLSGITLVTSTLRATMNTVGRGNGEEARRVDLDGPISVIDTTNLRSGAGALQGMADDSPGIGVALVEVNIDNAGWQSASGTDFWTLPLNIPIANSLNVQVRATDRYGQVGPVRTVQLIVDDTPPVAEINPPAIFTETAPSIPGTAFDGPTGGPLKSIEVLMLQPGRYVSNWQPVIRTAMASPDETLAPEAWRFWPGSLQGDAISITLQPRAVDAAGNVGYGSVKTVLLDNVAPKVTVTLALSNVAQTQAIGTTLIAGNASDGSGVQTIEVRVYDPNGNVYTETATLLPDGSFVYQNGQPLTDGAYTVRLFVTDTAGNQTTLGPFNLIVGPLLSKRLYLPIQIQGRGRSSVYFPIVLTP